ncbi:MAG: YnfA family protein [Myxococcales bacterium]|nr:YnfA family protein [Myxococcales bacterium]
MRAIPLFLLAGLLEIGGGYLVWLWLRERRPWLLGIAGLAALALYGVVPVLQAREHPFGRVYAAYGAVFILLSALWGWAVDLRPPDARDCIGIAICLAGALVMMWPRAVAAS